MYISDLEASKMDAPSHADFRSKLQVCNIYWLRVKATLQLYNCAQYQDYATTKHNDSLSCSGRFRVRISTRRSCVVIESVREFPHSFQIDAGAAP
jgi:hypothetical protein